MGLPVSVVKNRLEQMNVSMELIQQLLSFEQHEQNRKVMITFLQRLLRKKGKDRHINPDSTLGFPAEGPEHNAWITSKPSLLTPHTSLFALHSSLLTPLSSHRFNGFACICGKEPPRTNERIYGAHSTVIIFRARREKQKSYDNVSSETSTQKG